MKNVFSIKLINGINNIKNKKYREVHIIPNSIKGDSTCLAPKTIKKNKISDKNKEAYFTYRFELNSSCS